VSRGSLARGNTRCFHTDQKVLTAKQILCQTDLLLIHPVGHIGSANGRSEHMLYSPRALLRIQWRLRPGQVGEQTHSSNAAGGHCKRKAGGC